MLKDKFIKALLVLIAVLLCLNLLKTNLTSSLLYIEAQAKLEDYEPQTVDLSHISGIACSGSGECVYVAGEFFDTKEEKANRKCIFSSENFGRPGSWKMVAKEKIDF
jgi:Ran GTPase-activating protein (RanGAP) involved in mRNA processing and transport